MFEFKQTSNNIYSLELKLVLILALNFCKRKGFIEILGLLYAATTATSVATYNSYIIKLYAVLENAGPFIPVAI